MHVGGFNAPRPEAVRRTFGQQLATSAKLANAGGLPPNRAARRRWLALQTREVRMKARAFRRSWLPPHPLAIEQYMDAPAYEEYSAMSEEDQARIYRVTKNALKRRRRACA